METIAMSRRERGRLEVMGRVRRGEITVAKAGELLGLSRLRYGSLRSPPLRRPTP